MFPFLPLLAVATLATDPCAPAGRDALAGEYMTAVRQARGLRLDDLRYEPDEFRLRLLGSGETGCVLNLRNSADEYCKAPEAERPEIVARFARAVAAACGRREPAPATYAEVKTQLLPVVRSRAYVEAAHAAAGGSLMAGEPLGEDLFVALVRDLPDSMTFVTPAQLEGWKVAWATAYADALANLRARSPEPFVELAPGLWAGPWADSYAASRLLLTDRLRALVKNGDVVATVPSRDAIFVCGSEDAAALAKLAVLTEHESGEPRPVSALPILLPKAGTARVFAPAPEHPAHAAMARLRLLEWSRTYAEDKQRLDEAHGKSGTDVFVASFMVAEKNGQLTSLGVLTVGVHTLLPRTDAVAFVDLENGRSLLAVATFEDALRVLGPRAVLRPGYPPRWEVKETPPRAEVAKLGRLPGF